jgi:hypothetical protein
MSCEQPRPIEIYAYTCHSSFIEGLHTTKNTASGYHTMESSNKASKASSGPRVKAWNPRVTRFV